MQQAVAADDYDNENHGYYFYSNHDENDSISIK